MATLTAQLFFWIMILSCIAKSQFVIQNSQHVEHITTPQTTTLISSIMGNDRISVRKCQEYSNYFVRQNNDIHNENETTKMIEKYDTTTKNVRIPDVENRDVKNTTKDIGNEIGNFTSHAERPEEMAIENEETIDSIPNIAGGEDSKVGEFPHMAAIGWLNSDGSYDFNCGGTLVSPRFVLTAAHCTYSHAYADPAPRAVRLGDQNIDNNEDDAADPVQVNIKSTFVHPQYTHKKHYNDIALLELERYIDFNEYIEPACLWTSRDLGFRTKAIATGWGIVDPYTGRRSNELQKVILSVLSNEMCGSLLLNHINRRWNKGFLDTQLCAGELHGGKDTCQGDSGSPLQVPTRQGPNNYFVIGITSFGPKFCAQLPAVYTRVSSYIDWIESIVWPEEYRAWLNSTILNT